MKQEWYNNKFYTKYILTINDEYEQVSLHAKIL